MPNSLYDAGGNFSNIFLLLNSLFCSDSMSKRMKKFITIKFIARLEYGFVEKCCKRQLIICRENKVHTPVREKRPDLKKKKKNIF